MRLNDIETAHDARMVGGILAPLRATILVLSRMGWTVHAIYTDGTVRMTRGDVFCFVHGHMTVTPPQTWDTSHARWELRESGIDCQWPDPDVLRRRFIAQ